MIGGLSPLAGLPPLPAMPGAPGGKGAGGADGASFEAMLGGLSGAAETAGPAASERLPNLLVDGVRDVVGLQRHADGQIESLLTGGNVQPAEVLTSVQKADMAMRLLMQIRNKLVGAYQQIQDMRI